MLIAYTYDCVFQLIKPFINNYNLYLSLLYLKKNCLYFIFHIAVLALIVNV